MRFEIRRKEFNFSTAADLTGEAAYVPLVVRNGIVVKSGGRFVKALDAAIEAARIDHSMQDSSPRGAMVTCDHGGGPRPVSAMKHPMYVSYRPRD